MLSKITSGKKLMVIGIVGILLIGISSFLPIKSERKKQEEQISITEYTENAEKQLAEIVKKISGDKKATVMITLETGKRYEYAGETEDSSNRKTSGEDSEVNDGKKQKTITVKSSDGGEQALIVTEYMPEIRGVAVVCNGANNEKIKEAITEAVTAALNITSKRVSVTGGYEN